MTATTHRQATAAPGPDPFLPRRFVVRGHRQDTRDTYTLVLDAADGEPLPFAPGQFTMMQAFGVGEAPISISGDPAHPEAPRGGPGVGVGVGGEEEEGAFCPGEALSRVEALRGLEVGHPPVAARFQPRPVAGLGLLGQVQGGPGEEEAELPRDGPTGLVAHVGERDPRSLLDEEAGGRGARSRSRSPSVAGWCRRRRRPPTARCGRGCRRRRPGSGSR